MLVTIVKSDGSRETFNPKKLLSSLSKAGAIPDRAQEIVKEIEANLHEGMSTGEIYSRAFAKLHEHRPSAAARYSLKRAVLSFGPSGFPFEAYLAEIYRAEGYETITDQMVPGACVEHEVDIVMTKGGKTTYVEAKFHNNLGYKTDLQVALYVKARLDDIAARAQNPKPMDGILVTNTKFTSQVIEYASCAGVELLGWDYPAKGNLHDCIDSAQVYPITALTTLSQQEKDTLLSHKLVLCNGLTQEKDILQHLGIKGQRSEAIINEAVGLCAPGKDI